MTKVLFLPGGSASLDFWQPVAARLDLAQPPVFFAWPGLGDEPLDPQVKGLDDLVNMVLARMDKPVDVVAQSMGALVALKAALARPRMVRSLVLAATSGGLPLEQFGGIDWRPGYAQRYPQASPWFTTVREDLSLSLGGLDMPTLVLGGELDPISPLAVGRKLRELLPNSDLRVIKGGHHDFARTHPEETASLIREHLKA